MTHKWKIFENHDTVRGNMDLHVIAKFGENLMLGSC